MRKNHRTIETKNGVIRVEHVRIDLADLMRRRKERKRAELDRREQRAMKHAAAHALFSI